MSAFEWETVEDEYGKYKRRTNEFGVIEEFVMSRTQKWHDENPSQPEPLPEPTEIDILRAENEKIKQQLLQQGSDLSAFMEFYFSTT